MTKTKTYVTYAILDPVTSEVVYVGQTGNFEKRKQGHLRIKKRPNIRTENIKTWMFDQLDAGREPEFRVLQVSESEEDSYGVEDYCVKHFADRGQPLLNRWRHHQEIIRAANKIRS